MAFDTVSGRKHRLVSPWIVTFSVMLATFMEILDTTVVNVSIPHIAGNLAATVEEGTWVVTSYLVSNAIVLPISGWLANYIGRKKLLLACVAGFTVASLCCGLATSLSALIVFRILQGLTGGGLQPLAQAILLETFPQSKHGQAMAAFGIGILLAPILGPTLGGYITDNFSWRWIFYLNLPVGLVSLFMIRQFVVDPSYIHRKPGRVDLWGIGFLALGIGSLQIVLDTGQRNDWFSSDYIRFFAICCVAGLAALIIREMRTRDPVVDLRALANRTFSAGVFLIGLLGFVLYASLVLLPIYLQTLLGYPAYNAGLALSPRGIGSLATTLLAGYLTGKTNPRRLLIFGVLLGTVTMFDLSKLNLNAGYWDIFWPQVFQGAALSFLFIPLMAISMSSIPKEKMGNATSIFNLMRNIGGSFGIAIMSTFLSRRNQLHQNHLIEKIQPGTPASREMLRGLQGMFHVNGADNVTASRKALGALYGMVQRQAAMLSFVEAFWLMAALFAAMLPFLALLRHTRSEQPRAKVEEPIEIPWQPRKKEEEAQPDELILV